MKSDEAPPCGHPPGLSMTGTHPQADALREQQIHLWVTRLDEPELRSASRHYLALLSDEEQTRQRRFHFEKDRHRYLVTRALVRSTLSRYAGIAPLDWRFETNAYGKPSIAHDSPELRRLSFNLSHTDECVVLALADRVALGVDVEKAVPRFSVLDLAQRFFAPSEAQSLLSLPPAQESRRFFEYWTLKEAYIKARGMGLSIPLDRFSFDLSGEREIRLRVEDGEPDRAQNWQLWQWRDDADHLLALCVERCGAPQVQLRQVLPLGGEAPCRMELLRSSPSAGAAPG